MTAAGWRVATATRSGPSPRFAAAGSVPAPQDAADRLVAEVGHAVGGDLPELRVEHLERDVAVVADPRPGGRGSARSGSPPRRAGSGRRRRPARAGVPLRSQTWTQARFSRREVGQVLELARPGVVVEQVEADARRPATPHWAIRASVVSRLAQKPRRLLELQGQPDARAAGQLGGLGQRRRRPGRSRRASSSRAKSAATISVGDPQLLEQGQPAAEVVPVGRALRPAREQQPPLRRPPRRARRPLGVEQLAGRRRPCAPRGTSPASSARARPPSSRRARRPAGRPRTACSGSSPG